jgi:hypothetical protein
VPRGRFGMGAPPTAPGSATQKKGELYGNRVAGLGRPHHMPTLNRNVTSSGSVQTLSDGQGVQSKRRVASESVLDSLSLPEDEAEEVDSGVPAADVEPVELGVSSSGTLADTPEEVHTAAPLQVVVDSANSEDGTAAIKTEDPPSPASTTTIHAAVCLDPLSLPPSVHQDVGDQSASVAEPPILHTQSSSKADDEPATASGPAISASPPTSAAEVPVSKGSTLPTQSVSVGNDPAIPMSIQDPVTSVASPVQSPRESRPPTIPLPSPSLPSNSSGLGLPPTPASAESTNSSASIESDLSDAEIVTQPQVLRISPRPSRVRLISTPPRKNSSGDLQDDVVIGPPSAGSGATTPLATLSQPQNSAENAQSNTKKSASVIPQSTTSAKPLHKSFTAVVHRKETVKAAAPSTPVRSRTYGPSSSASGSQTVDAPKSRVEPPSPAAGGDLAALLADAAFLEQQLEFGGYFSPRKDVFSTSDALAGTLGVSSKSTSRSGSDSKSDSSAKAHGRNLSVQTIKADQAQEDEKPKDKIQKDKSVVRNALPNSTDTPPPTPPPKSPQPGLLSGFRSLRKRASTAYPRDSIGSEMSYATEDSVVLQTPNTTEELGVMVTPPHSQQDIANGRPSSVFMDNASIASSRWSMKSNSTSPRKGIGRAASFAGKMFGKSKSRTPSIMTIDSRGTFCLIAANASVRILTNHADESHPGASSPAPSLKPLELNVSSSSLSPPELNGDRNASRRESWMSSTPSDLSSPGFDEELFDAFPSVPSTASTLDSQPTRGSLALDTSNIPMPKYGQTEQGTTLLTPPSRSSSLFGFGKHQKHSTSPS